MLDGEKIIFSQKKIIKPRIEVGNDFNRYGARFLANSAVYLPADSQHPEGWRFDEVTSPMEFLKNASLRSPDNGQVVFYSPSDNNWLEEDQLFVATHLSPTILLKFNLYLTSGYLNLISYFPISFIKGP